MMEGATPTLTPPLMEDEFPCLSRNKEVYRLLLTKTQLILVCKRDPAKVEKYNVADIFGCHTLRHKKVGPTYTSAYVCFYIFPKTKKKSFASQVRLREKTTLVFEIRKEGKTYEDNLAIGTTWKETMLTILSKNYPKWQMIGGGASNDIMDHQGGGGDAGRALTSYIPFIRRYLVILNPKSGQGKTLEIFKVIS